MQTDKEPKRVYKKKRGGAPSIIAIRGGGRGGDRRGTSLGGAGREDRGRYAACQDCGGSGLEMRLDKREEYLVQK